MPDPTLAEVAADVAAALGLPHDLGDEWSDSARPMYSHNRTLRKDGADLVSPYWRCACEDWLLKNGHRFTPSIEQGKHYCYAYYGRFNLEVDCPWPEAPARLVSAVWLKW